MYVVYNTHTVQNDTSAVVTEYTWIVSNGAYVIGLWLKQGDIKPQLYVHLILDT